MKKWEFNTKQLAGFYLTAAVAGGGAWVCVDRVRAGGSEIWPLLVVVLMLTASGVILAMSRPVTGKPNKRKR